MNDETLEQRQQRLLDEAHAQGRKAIRASETLYLVESLRYPGEYHGVRIDPQSGYWTDCSPVKDEADCPGVAAKFWCVHQLLGAEQYRLDHESPEQPDLTALLERSLAENTEAAAFDEPIPPAGAAGPSGNTGAGRDTPASSATALIHTDTHLSSPINASLILGCGTAPDVVASGPTEEHPGAIQPGSAPPPADLFPHWSEPRIVERNVTRDSISGMFLEPGAEIAKVEYGPQELLFQVMTRAPKETDAVNCEGKRFPARVKSAAAIKRAAKAECIQVMKRGMAELMASGKYTPESAAIRLDIAPEAVPGILCDPVYLDALEDHTKRLAEVRANPSRAFARPRRAA